MIPEKQILEDKPRNKNMSVSEKELANAIRALSMDAVEQSKSGHPGMPLGFADVATVLFKDFLKFSSKNPEWPDRDRFVLSAGHGSMLLYSLLYLTGYEDISLEDIKNFRQLGSKTAGHPEVEMLAGIETTTGPLGQGLANAVGMAFAEKLMNARFPDLVGHDTYTAVGDGCLMEGISQEAISFAGHYKLNKLTVLFDDNNICIDGDTSLSTSEDHVGRFKACGWDVISIDGHNHGEIRNALKTAKSSPKPVMISCKTTIAYGSPNKSGSASSHGAPLGQEEIELTKKALNWPYGSFEVPDEILSEWRKAGVRSEDKVSAWQEKLNSHPDKAEFERLISGALPENWQESLHKFKAEAFEAKKKIATRQSSGNVLEVLTKDIPELIGGSADLTGSNNTKTSHTDSITIDNYQGRYVHYGIREHAMGAMMNGMALHGGIIPYSGTFLVFSDYCKPAIRLSALMKQKVIYVFTHDSIGLGEDGPTHQPIEHLDALRLIPDLIVLRPCDTVETAECWEIALSEKGAPIALSLTRQGLEPAVMESSSVNKSAKGGYVISAEKNSHQVTIIASGSEVEIAIVAQKELEESGIGARVVSMPAVTLFDKQSKSYKQEVLGEVPAVAIEASKALSYYRYAKTFIGMESFGASAKAVDLYEHFSITSKRIIKEVKEIL